MLTQDPHRFGGGAAAQLEAFVEASRALGRQPRVVWPRYVSVVDSLGQVVQSPAIARRVREATSLWVVATAAPYGAPAVRSGRPYAAWIGTDLATEWASRRGRLSRSREFLLRLNAPLLLRLERAVLRGARRLYATSPASRASIAAAAGLPEERVGLLPIPVGVERIVPEPDGIWRSRLERPVVTFVGRGDDPRKNLDLLLAAWPGVRRMIPDATLRLVGRPPDAALPAGVEALGEIDSVADALRSSSLFVLPSLQEGFGIVVAEALAAGLPVVTTPCGGPEALVRESGGGVVLSDFQTGTMASAIVRALGDRERLLDQRLRGRAYVETEHSPGRLQLELATAFAELERA